MKRLFPTDGDPNVGVALAVEPAAAEPNAILGIFDSLVDLKENIGFFSSGPLAGLITTFSNTVTESLFLLAAVAPAASVTSADVFEPKTTDAFCAFGVVEAPKPNWKPPLAGVVFTASVFDTFVGVPNIGAEGVDANVLADLSDTADGVPNKN